jgi:hypothetical protein
MRKLEFAVKPTKKREHFNFYFRNEEDELPITRKLLLDALHGIDKKKCTISKLRKWLHESSLRWDTRIVMLERELDAEKRANYRLHKLNYNLHVRYVVIILGIILFVILFK